VNPEPVGPRLVLDRSVRTFRDGTVLTGGNPGRLITLSRSGVRTLDRLLGEGPRSPAERDLSRRLVDAGMAHPTPPRTSSERPEEASVTVVVPVRDRVASLDRCLASLGRDVPVVVVDDASSDPRAVAEVCARHGANLLTRAHNGGPAAARNDAIAVLDCELVAFVDSDCTVSEGWLGDLLWMFEDPDVGAVAPRVRPDRPPGGAPGSVLDRYSDGRSALDLGPEPSEVGPERTVRYLPTAALVVRGTALAEGFDSELRVGEDVDLVWRLLEEGWRIRYEPSVVVHHHEPSSWVGLLARRFHYGTSAGPLSRRHPGRLAPVDLRPGPTAVVVALLTGQRRLAAVVGLASTATLAHQVHGRGIPIGQSVRWSAESVGWTLVGVGRAATMVAGPALLLVALRSRRWSAAAALLVLTPPAVDWRRRRPDLDPVRWSLASVLDDMAYGAGVWAGCIRSRSFEPLIPSLRLGRWGRNRAVTITPS
jgi:mycofactocin system glycosyltransferase